MGILNVFALKRVFRNKYKYYQIHSSVINQDGTLKSLNYLV